jgi:hypothetical protein
MPMDAKEFKRRVTEHFESVTEEEFLENLRKSLPYLSVEESGDPKEFQAQSNSDIDNNMVVNHD